MFARLSFGFAIKVAGTPNRLFGLTVLLDGFSRSLAILDQEVALKVVVIAKVYS